MTERKTKIGIMGGTFNPVHLGHTGMALDCLNVLALDRIMFLPDGDPPHKRNITVDKLQRLEMVKLAIASENRFFVDDMEIKRKKTTYTFDTINEIKQKYTNCTFSYIIGADTLPELITWYRAEDVLKMLDFIVVGRNDSSKTLMNQTADYLHGKYGATITVTDIQGRDISSTDIRNAVKQGKSISDMVCEDVERYIYDNKLYTT